MSELFIIGFKQQIVVDYVTEIVYPFGNYVSDYYKQFMIAVRSPGQYYYTDLFASFILSVDEAWDLYKKLLEFQQIEDQFITEDGILSLIPNHLDSLEKQFKKFYNKSYTEVCRNLDLNNLDNYKLLNKFMNK